MRSPYRLCVCVSTLTLLGNMSENTFPLPWIHAQQYKNITTPISLMSVLIIHFHLCLGLPNCLHRERLWNCVHISHLSDASHPVLTEFFILMKFWEERKLWCSTSPTSCYSFSLNYLGSVLSDSLTMCASPRVSDQVSRRYKLYFRCCSRSKDKSKIRVLRNMCNIKLRFWNVSEYLEP